MSKTSFPDLHDLTEGSAYESTISGNTWSPTGYPQGWKKIR